jgi:predicted RNA-binding Zn-ribbon protein involved in translation (DUF1610 family)
MNAKPALISSHETGRDDEAPCTCERCTSSDLHWFTRAEAASQGVVFLCRRCGQLTIISARASRAAVRRMPERVLARAS